MYSRIKTAALSGIYALPVFAEVDLSAGLPVFDMVGNISPQVREGKERVKTALHNMGISLPAKRITVNLSPSDIRKDGAAFDLPIAIGIMTAMQLIDPESAGQFVFVGELNLCGDLMPVNGILPIVSDGMNNRNQKFIVPFDNLKEARLVNGAIVYGFHNIMDLFTFLLDGTYEETELYNEGSHAESILDFSDVNGQKLLRRAAEVAAGGMHNLLLVGPPGAGKTMIAERIAGILPPLTQDEMMEISKIYSVKGLLNKMGGLIRERPFRNPHHTISKVGMSGGGINLMPGEISLAHSGVLFLDELTEFDKTTLEILRQPLEDKEIHLTRAMGSVTYPSNFLLLGAMNPCNCGYYPNLQYCRCTPATRKKYFERLSQPLLDRIDICVRAEPLTFQELVDKDKNEATIDIRKRVIACQEIQINRYRNESFYHNANIPASKIDRYCKLNESDKKYMKDLYEKYHLTGRTYHKVLRVARTIADLDFKEQIERTHLIEAFAYRNQDIISFQEENL